MGFHQDRPPVALQALDDPALPRWAVQIEGPFQGVGDGPGQLGLVAGVGNGYPAHVVGQVEVRAVDPLLVQRMRPQQLRAPRDRQDAFRQKAFEPLVVGRGADDDGHRADRQARVPIRIVGLKECRVQCLCHAGSRCSPLC
jgi:hypothetical protein